MKIYRQIVIPVNELVNVVLAKVNIKQRYSCEEVIHKDWMVTEDTEYCRWKEWSMWIPCGGKSTLRNQNKEISGTEGQSQAEMDA